MSTTVPWLLRHNYSLDFPQASWAAPSLSPCKALRPPRFSYHTSATETHLHANEPLLKPRTSYPLSSSTGRSHPTCPNFLKTELMLFPSTSKPALPSVCTISIKGHPSHPHENNLGVVLICLNLTLHTFNEPKSYDSVSHIFLKTCQHSIIPPPILPETLQ